MSPVVAAGIGVVITLVAYNLAGMIKQRFLRGLAQLASVIVPVGLVGIMCATPEAAGQAGQYYFVAIIVAYGLGKLFGGSEKT